MRLQPRSPDPVPTRVKRAKTFQRCGSSFEHVLYWCALFTIGLGRWFYRRPVLNR
jgi:hypothetical protein